MANTQKGEISLTVDGKEYVLFLDANAMVLLEEHFSTLTREVGYNEILARVLTGESLRYMRAFIWAALQKHHAPLSLIQAGELINAAGGISAFATQVSAAVGLSLPTDDELKALGLTPDRPQRAQPNHRRVRRTGKDSSATRGASV